MAMLSAGDRMRSEQSHGRMPAFVLDSNNLECYRPWLKRVREWARSKGGRVMELHLIGEEVPVAELTAQALAEGDVNVDGRPAKAIEVLCISATAHDIETRWFRDDQLD